MSATAYKLAQKLKNIQAANGNDRLARSLNLVHAFALTLPVTSYATAEQAAEATTAELKRVINEVNEHVSIDTRLTLALYPQVLKLRYELLNGTCDPALIHMVLRSDAAKEIKNAEDMAMTEYLTSRPDFVADQQYICDALRELHAQAS